MKNVLIIGRSDHDNFGDSLMFMFYIKKLIEINCKPFIYKPSRIFMKRIFDEGLTCQVFDPQVDKIDQAFFIGGGYFGEPDIGAGAWSERFLKERFFFDAANFLIENKIRYYIHGVEVGPLSNVDVLAQVRFILGNAENVVVRNLNSQDFCKKYLNIDVNFCRDVVLYESSHYCQDSASRSELILHATGKFLKKNPVSWIFRRKIVSYVKSNNITSIKILFDQSEYSELQARAVLFKNQLETSISCIVEIVEYTGVSNVIKHVRSGDRLITSKLHLGMVGLSVGSQVLCISDMPKNKRFYSEVFAGLGIISLTQAIMPWFKINQKYYANTRYSDKDQLESSRSNIRIFEEFVS
ncbi:MAG: polysaccharide pyruvyl transferase family protein [Gammaproteobacteria bacterium]|nr:polysaccharide pyruvyl transferase family protein [Gammaproteobacteria bacterium]